MHAEEENAAPGPNATLHLLRRQIVSGKFVPGCRLPTRRKLSTVLGVSPVTLQRALDRLEQEGFVRSVDRVGSFVAATPPHLTRYPIIFTGSPDLPDRPWNRFWQTIKTFSPEVAAKTGMQMPVYLNIDGHQDNEDFQTLVRDIELKRLAGLIFPTNPWLLNDTPLVNKPGIPRVAFAGHIEGIHTVTPDFTSFFERAVEYLAQRGRHRVGFLISEHMLARWHIDPESLLGKFGMCTRPEWIQIIGPSCSDSARSVLHLLMSPRYPERPDGLILADDNWMDHATAGLIAAGVRVPEDADVVTHCNFPYPEPRVLPFKRLGWDVRHLISAALDVLIQQRDGRNPPMQRRMAAVFDHELASQ